MSLPVINWCINLIVLRVEWWFNGKHALFIPKPYEVKLYLLQQLLCATSFDTVELEIAINYFVYSQSVNASFT